MGTQWSPLLISFLGTGFCCRFGVRSGPTAWPLLVLWWRELHCPGHDRAEAGSARWVLGASEQEDSGLPLPVFLLTLSSCGMLGEAGSGVTPMPAPGQSLPCFSELAELWCWWQSPQCCPERGSPSCEPAVGLRPQRIPQSAAASLPGLVLAAGRWVLE